jgi:hypothetical protein
MGGREGENSNINKVYKVSRKKNTKIIPFTYGEERRRTLI